MVFEEEYNGILKFKIFRVVRIIGVGVKVGGNYLKYYVKKMVNLEFDKEELYVFNVQDIYKLFSKLKGFVLKVV